jgi:hypothetical protein
LVYEGTTKQTPLKVYAKQKGIRIKSLDSHNPHYNLLNGFIFGLAKRGLVSLINDITNDRVSNPEYNCLQKSREDVWVKRIAEYPKINKALMIVGAKHLENRFGLIDKLSEKGISINAVYMSDILKQKLQEAGK